MTYVFLSYAREDEAVAVPIVQWLRDRRAETDWWQNPEQRGGRFVSGIEQGIARADLFLVLLSPHYLTSSWCRHERELALQREIDLDRRFIYVLKVADTSYPESGLLRNYDRLDATPPLDSIKLDAIATTVPLDGEPETAEPAPARPTPVFRNRDDELAAVVNALTTSGGQDLWVVVSSPRMGKSWLLDRVQRTLTEKDPRWKVRLVDLREHPGELRTNAARLLGTLLDVDVAHLPDEGPLPADGLVRVATAVSSRRQPQLYLLDSADLLDQTCATYMRSALTYVYSQVKQGGNRHTRLGLVIGTRRHDDWRGLGRDAHTGLRFEPRPLTEFRVDVVHQALAELDRDLGANERWDCAQRLHRLSEGLPALLIHSLNWAVKHEFLTIELSDGDATFDEVARPYIRDDLLAVESLLPSGSEHERQAMSVLGRALRVLVAYRLFTQSHLSFHLDADQGFAQALADARWSRADLWDALSSTSLCGHSRNDLWQVIEPSLRRLLYRYYHRTAEERIAAQVVARRFYEGWTAVRNAGKEQPVVLVECLWHEASRMVIEQPDELPHLLPMIALILAQEFAGSPIYQLEEFSLFVVGRLRDDDEFQMLLQRHDGLFEEIVKSVLQAIGGG